jgi:hypothetical protein
LETRIVPVRCYGQNNFFQDTPSIEKHDNLSLHEQTTKIDN